ncbi:LOW QUALITY PROTEIN: hypothetical protein QTO34_015552 [Cnephaeus nilssonii]|uniref:Uncharacterized protein n=1 Tax=Cnephaeus nilssonii TaxID=3371016 RepID=A0AA40I527_CNENI|nr:LOW QUALITY PROTEIN: hypothetical protein QTO34_015552 [Eptesicus nilssonii]
MADYSFGPPAPEGQLSSPEGLVCAPAEDGNSTSPLETQSNSALGVHLGCELRTVGTWERLLVEEAFARVADPRPVLWRPCALMRGAGRVGGLPSLLPPALPLASSLPLLRGPCWTLDSSSDFCVCYGPPRWIQDLGCERSAMWAPGLRTLQLLLLLGASWARAGAPRCTYTFVLPQQKFTGAVCWSGPAAARPATEAVNASEVAALRVRVGRHEELLRELQRLAAVDGDVAGEVRALRKESRGLSTRLGQLRTQLQHEAGPGPGAEPAAALALLGERVLNASAEAQRAAVRFHQLDVKFRELARLVSQQSSLIARLERLCPGGGAGSSRSCHRPWCPWFRLVGGASDNSRLDPAPESQRDQTPRQQGPLAFPLPAGHPAVPTKPAGPWQDCAEAHGQAMGRVECMSCDWAGMWCQHGVSNSWRVEAGL